MIANLNGLVWLLLSLGILLLLQRSLHREIQAVFLLLTHRQAIALVMFSILFFPGVLLHEVSHYLVAVLTGVRTGGFSLIPRPLQDGRLQLGYVETVPTDFVRESLIGVAPLVSGGLFVTFAGLYRLGLPVLWDSLTHTSWDGFIQALSTLPIRPDFWLWFYLTFVISSTMLPSSSDRRAWLPLGLVAGVLLGLSLLAGAGPWLLIHLAPPVNRALLALAMALGISAALHLVLLLPTWIVRFSLMRLTGYRLA